jgi:hypothetical protein
MSSADQKRKRSQAKAVGDMVSSESIPTTYSHRAGVWSEAEDELLYSWQQRIGNKWSEVARHIPGKTGQQCAQRWRHKVNPDIKRDKWTEEEDALLVRLVHQFGNRWALISRNVPGRTDQQCMGRWKRHLDPNIKRDGWSLQEDIHLCALYFRYRTQWSDISRGLDGRTPQQCRTRWQNLSQSQFVKTYHQEIENVDIAAVEEAQMAINMQRESVTGLPTATTRARMPGKNKRAPGRRKASVGGSSAGKNAIYYREPANESSRSAAAAAMLVSVGQHQIQQIPSPQPATYLGSLHTLQYPPSMLPPGFAAPTSHMCHESPDSWDPPSKRSRVGPIQEALVARGRNGGAGELAQLVPSVAGRAARSGGRLRKSTFDGTVGVLAAIDRSWHARGVDGLCGPPVPGCSQGLHGPGLQSNSAVPVQDAVEDGMMLPISRLHQHMTPLKPEAGGGTGGAGTDSVGSGHEDGQGIVKDEHGNMMGDQPPTGRHGRQVESNDYYRDTGSFLGLEYLADDKVPGSKTPLSALKHAKTAISPMLADLLCSPLISKDQMRGMQSMQALLASPPGGINRVPNLRTATEAGRLTSDVVRCLDMSEAVTSPIGSFPGGKMPGANADGQIKPVVDESAPHAFAAVYTPDHIGSRAPLVLDSIGRMGATSVMMKNALLTEREDHNSLYGKLDVVNRQGFVQMPVSNDAEWSASGTASAGTRYPAPPARQILASHDGPAGFRQPWGNNKAGSRRRLSIDDVRMSLHALLDKA